MHRRNAAERVIQTFKDHFKAILCGWDPRFPLFCWCLLIPQAVLTLSLLRTSCLNPKLSAWSCLNGPFAYDAHPIAPLGTHVVMQRTTRAPSGIDGWCVGPDFECYQCHTCINWRTNKVVHPDTVAWFPHQVHMPTSSTTEVLSQAITDLAEALVLHDPLALLPPNQAFSSPTLSQLNLPPPNLLPNPNPAPLPSLSPQGHF